MASILLKRGSVSEAVEFIPKDGEVIFNTDNTSLMVGWYGKLHSVALVVEGPHDHKLYAKIKNEEKMIPLFVSVR
jgi:hypothetical protein